MRDQLRSIYRLDVVEVSAALAIDGEEHEGSESALGSSVVLNFAPLTDSLLGIFFLQLESRVVCQGDLLRGVRFYPALIFGTLSLLCSVRNVVPVLHKSQYDGYDYPLKEY